VKDFFTGRAGIREMTSMLAQRPGELLSALIRTVPEDLHGELGIKDWEWARGLLDDGTGVLARAGDELEHDTQLLQEILASLQKQRKPSDHILRALNTVEHRELIGYLAARGVLPKYGFPVESVEFRLNNHSPHARDTRDGFWPSLLYGLPEGLFLTLDVERCDLDGCLYPVNGRLFFPALVLYDNVPRSAGYVRCAADPSAFKDIVKASRLFLASCEVRTSCSGCLINFRNQLAHR